MTTESPVDGYFAELPESQRATLQALRDLVHQTVPGAEESVSYGIPTFKHRGRPLVYFGVAKEHYAVYGTSAGTLRYPHGEPPPLEHIRELILARAAEIDAKAKPPRGPAS